MLNALLPLDKAHTTFDTVEVPEIGSHYVSPNGRHGTVVITLTKFTKSGYGTLNIGFESYDPETGLMKMNWACVSPMA